jgi:hypothetical protein
MKEARNILGRMKNRDEVQGAVKQERSLEKGKTAKLSSKRISLCTF